MEKKYTVQKIHELYSGAGWQSKSDLREEWAVVIEPYGIQVRTFKTEAEANEYLAQKEREWQYSTTPSPSQGFRKRP